MHTAAIRTLPLSYSKACDTFRPLRWQGATRRTGLGGKSFVHFFVPGPCRNRLIFEHASEGRPARIQYRLRHAGLGESCGIHIAYRDVVKLPDNAIRELMVEIVSAIRNLRMDCINASLLVGALRNGQRLFCAAIDALRFNLLTSGQRGEVLQAKVDADTAFRLARAGGIDRNINHDIKEPVAARILRKIGAVLDLPFGQGAAIEHPERVARKAESIAFALQVAPLDWNPSKRLLPAIAKIRALLLGSRFGVLLAHRIDGAGMQAKLLAAARGELVQVKAGQPWATKAKGVLLPIVTVIPDEVARSGLLVQQAIQRFHPVSVDENHFCFFKNSAIARRISSETGTSNFSDSVRSWASIGSGRNVFVRFIYTRYQLFNRKASKPAACAPFTPRPEGRGFSETN
jgi:hypothetical protein